MMGRKDYLRGLGLGILVTALLMGAAKGNGREMTDEEIRKRAAELGMIENTVLAETDETVQELETEEAGQPEQKPETEEAGQSEQKPETEEAEQSEQKPETEEADQAEQEPETEEAGQSEQKPETEEAGQAEQKPETEKADQAEQKPETEEAEQSEQKPETEEAGQPEQKPTDGTEKRETTVGGREDCLLTIVSGDSSVSVAGKLEQAGVISSAASYDAYLCANGYDKKIRAGSYTIPADAGEEEIARIITGMN